MNNNNAEMHKLKAMVVEELSKNKYVPQVDTLTEQSSPKPENVPMDSALLAQANNPKSVEGHLQKWRCLTK